MSRRSPEIRRPPPLARVQWIKVGALLFCLLAQLGLIALVRRLFF